MSWLVGLPVAYNAFLVHDDYGAGSCAALLIPEVISGGYLTLGMPVGQLGVGESAIESQLMPSTWAFISWNRGLTRRKEVA